LLPTSVGVVLSLAGFSAGATVNEGAELPTVTDVVTSSAKDGFKKNTAKSPTVNVKRNFFIK
jgi:hypothetical protein